MLCKMCPSKLLTLYFMISISMLAVNCNPVESVLSKSRKFKSNDIHYLPVDSTTLSSELALDNPETSKERNGPIQVQISKTEVSSSSTEETVQLKESTKITDGSMVISLMNVQNNEKDDVNINMNKEYDEEESTENDDGLNEQQEIDKDEISFVTDHVSNEDEGIVERGLKSLKSNCEESGKEEANIIEPSYSLSRSLLPPLDKNKIENNKQVHENININNNIEGKNNENIENNKDDEADPDYENDKVEQKVQDYEDSILFKIDEQKVIDDQTVIDDEYEDDIDDQMVIDELSEQRVINGFDGQNLFDEVKIANVVDEKRESEVEEQTIMDNVVDDKKVIEEVGEQKEIDVIDERTITDDFDDQRVIDKVDQQKKTNKVYAQKEDDIIIKAIPTIKENKELKEIRGKEPQKNENFNDSGHKRGDTSDDYDFGSARADEVLEKDETIRLEDKEETDEKDTDESDGEPEIHIIIKGIKRLIRTS